MPLLREKGNRLVSGVQRPPYYLGALRDEDAVLRPVPIQKLRLRQPCIDVQLSRVKICDLDNIPHLTSP